MTFLSAAHEKHHQTKTIMGSQMVPELCSPKTLHKYISGSIANLGPLWAFPLSIWFFTLYLVVLCVCVSLPFVVTCTLGFTAPSFLLKTFPSRRHEFSSFELKLPPAWRVKLSFLLNGKNSRFWTTCNAGPFTIIMHIKVWRFYQLHMKNIIRQKRLWDHRWCLNYVLPRHCIFHISLHPYRHCWFIVTHMVHELIINRVCQTIP